MDTFLRLRDCVSGTYFIVNLASGRAFAATRAEPRIGLEDEISGPIAERAVASALDYRSFFEVAVPGNTTPDGNFEVRGALTRREQNAFGEGASVPVERPALLLHLDYFDRDLDGRISLAENYAGWRRLGFSKLAAAAKTALSAVLFGRLVAGLAIDVEAIGARRYARATGIYHADGSIDHDRLDHYRAAFDAGNGRLTFEETIAQLENSAAGSVSRGQFRSLFSVCERLNRGERIVTAAQFRGLFDGSLLWLAASAATGHRAAGRGGSPR
jgi:hypothetical protein